MQAPIQESTRVILVLSVKTTQLHLLYTYTLPQEGRAGSRPCMSPCVLVFRGKQSHLECLMSVLGLDLVCTSLAKSPVLCMFLRGGWKRVILRNEKIM